MKLPSGTDVKDETLSEIADFLAMDMLSTECSYNDSCSPVAEELENGYEGEYETLPGLALEDREFLLELVRVPTLQYLSKLRYAESNLFEEEFKGKQWVNPEQTCAEPEGGE